MVAWESDAVVVLMITGNAAGGKDGTELGLAQGTHSLHTGAENEWQQDGTR